MKQYRAKLTTPISDKGKIHHEGINAIAVNRYFTFDPAVYPDIFEEVEVKSDEELFVEWFKGINYVGIAGLFRLMSTENAINPEWLKKLRGECGSSN